MRRGVVQALGRPRLPITRQRRRWRHQQQLMALPAAALLWVAAAVLLLSCSPRACHAFVLRGGQQAPAAARGQRQASSQATALEAIALGGGEGGVQAQQAVAAPSAAHQAAAAASPATAPAAAPSVARARWPQLWGRDLRSPFVSVEVRPATRLEELLAVIDLRAECFAEQQGPLSVEAKLKHVKHVLARRARGAVVLVATARDLLSPFSEEVVVGSIECSTHEFEARSPFLHDHPTIPKLYVSDQAARPSVRPSVCPCAHDTPVCR